MVIRSMSAGSAPAIYDVCAIGNAIVDIIVDCDEATLQSMNIAKGGMTLIDEERADLLCEKVGPGLEVSGGSVANTVAGMAALGGTPTYMGKVKDDHYGQIFRHDMRATGVHFPTRPSTLGPSTARCIILVTPDAERSMSTYLGACVDLSPEDVDAQIVGNAQYLFLEGYLFDKPKAQEAFLLASQLAHQANRQVALSLSDSMCVERNRDGFVRLIHDQVDCLISNEKEIMSLYQTNSFEEAVAYASKECSLVVATRSAKGAVVAHGESSLVIEAEKVQQVVDTTGAGDLFAAGFLFGMTHGHDVATSTRLGAITAAEVISHYGPRPQGNLKELVRSKGIRI